MTDLAQHQYFFTLSKDLHEELNQLTKKIHLLDQRLNQSEDIKMNHYKVIILDQPQQCVYGIKRTINITKDAIQNVFTDLYHEIEEKGIKRTGAACGPVIERFIVDDHTTDNFCTGILFPVVDISSHAISNK